jgi:N-acetylglucosaminyl-diphospho-decaprenol L-rhamnosyltransferase
VTHGAEGDSVGAVVVTFNGRERTSGLLKELDAALTDGLLHHVSIVDNYSTDGTAELVKEWSEGRSDITLDLQAINSGFPKAVNAGLDRLKTHYVAILNPDLSGIAPALRACLAQLDADETTGLCGPRLVMPNGAVQTESARMLPGVRTLLLRATGLSRPYSAYRRRLIARARRPIDAKGLSGAFLVGRRAQLQAMGGLDERIFMYLEDVSLCQRVRAEGLRLICVNEDCMHACGASRKSLSERQHRALDCLIGEVPWLLARDAGRPWACIVITALTFVIGVESLVLPTRSSRTGWQLLSWAVSGKPRYVGWTPPFAASGT